jgi:hypothetical protein
MMGGFTFRLQEMVLPIPIIKRSLIKVMEVIKPNAMTIPDPLLREDIIVVHPIGSLDYGSAPVFN